VGVAETAVLYVANVAGRPIYDAIGDRVATLKDLVVRLDAPGYPPLIGLVARTGRRNFFVPISQVASLASQGAHLRTSLLNLQPFERREGEVLLEHDVLDRQLIDIEGRRVVRANDVALAEADGLWRLVGIDVGHRALVRRIAPAGMVKTGNPELLDWAEMEPFASAIPEVRLRVPHDKIGKLHPADIARILESVSYPQASEIVASLDDETAAETLGELDEQLQADLVEHMDEARAADVLEEMSPDDAADLLGDLPRAKADALLEEMEQLESEEVQRLLTYPEDCAGGIMTTEYVHFLATYTTRQVIASIRATEEQPDHLYNIYVMDANDPQKLVGVASLLDLLLADPDDRLESFMNEDVHTAAPEMAADDVAQFMADYNLLALPVVDPSGHMLGLVTVDDAMDIVLPESARSHMPRLFR